MTVLKYSWPSFIVEPFRHYCAKNGMKEWSSDDLRAWIDRTCTNLSKHIAENPNAFGYIMSCIVKEELAVEVGRRPSTRLPANGRKIGVYRFT